MKSQTEADLPVELHELIIYAARNVMLVLEGGSLSNVFASLQVEHRAAVQAITYHTIRTLGFNQAVLQYLLIGKKIKTPEVKGILLVAISLLTTKEKGVAYKPFVILDQAVKAVRKYIKKGEHQTGFVNAILRSAQRDLAILQTKVRSMSEEAYWNYPLWWIKKLKQHYPEDYESILQAGNRPSPIFLRVNRRKTTLDKMVQMFHDKQIVVEPLPPYAFALFSRATISSLPGYTEGYWSVQDLGAQKIVEQLPLQDGLRVLDACAAPGGKTSHILERAKVDLLALDLQQDRIDRVNENLNRLGLQATTRVASCTDLLSWWDGIAFDVILADVPCTASGIVSRHPEIKWLRREDDILQSVVVQYAILESLWQTLKVGGILMYVTCSVFQEENEAQVERFMREYTDASLLEPSTQLLPNTHEVEISQQQNGFFYALLQKKPI